MKLNKKKIVVAVLTSGIFFIFGILLENNTDILPHLNINQKKENQEVYDNFTIKIEDIDSLINDEIRGYLYIGRDTCPVCLAFNRDLERVLKKDKSLVIYKFDTDFWRDNENFDSIINKFDVLSIPLLIKIDKDGNFEKFNSKDNDNIEISLHNFLYK